MAQFNGCCGARGTAIVLYLARQHRGLTLREIGVCVSGAWSYKAVSVQVSRFKKRQADDTWLREKVAQCWQVFEDSISQL